MHQHVGAFGHFRDRFERRGVAGKCDRTVLKIEAIGERRLNRRMLDEDRGYLDVVVLHHRTRRPRLPCTLTEVSGFILRSSAQKSTVCL